MTGIILVSSLLNRYQNRKDHQTDKDLLPPKRHRRGSVLWAISGLLLLGVSVFVANNPPIINLPAPTGPDPVGTTFFHFIDTDRDETATADTNDVRSLWIQVWYPTEQIDNLQRAPVMPESERFAGDMMKSAGLPAFMASHVDLIKSHSYMNAPLKASDMKYPIIIYSHGYTGYLSDNTQKMEALASHGYVVFSIAHSYETQLSLRQDGSWLTLEDSNSINVFSRETQRDTASYNQASRADDAIRKKAGAPLALSPQERMVLDSLYQVAFAGRRDRMNVWAADHSFALDEIEKMHRGERESIFQGRLDLKRVGSFGASFGVATAGLFSATDPRCLASINIDGSQYGALYGHSLAKPHMMIYGQNGWNDKLRSNDWEYAGNASPYLRIAIKGARHGNIGDPLMNFYLARKLGIGMVGSIYPDRMSEICNAYILAFFDKFLKDEERELLDGENRFEEVDFRRH